MKRFFQSWIINTLAVLVAVYLVKGIHYQAPMDLVIASLLLGILNAVVRPLLVLLTAPLLLFSLGLFYLVINALLLYFVGAVLRPHFYVDSFSSAFFGGLVISIISTVISVLTGMNKSPVRIEHRTGKPPRDGGDDGPVIDV